MKIKDPSDVGVLLLFLGFFIIASVLIYSAFLLSWKTGIVGLGVLLVIVGSFILLIDVPTI